MGYIYKITNNINDKIYIGKTTRTLEIRFKEHCNNTSGCKSALYNAICKYGKEHFKISKVEECEIDKLNEREKYWIQYYNSYKNGYNLTPGGDGISLSEEKILQIRKLWEQGYNCIEISNKLSLAHSTVYHRICQYDDYDKEENRRRAKKNEYKAINVYDKNKNFITSYFSISEGAKQLNISSKDIDRGLHRHILIQQKYYFSYKGDILVTKNKYEDTKRKICQFSKEGSFIQEFNGIREAGRILNIDYTSILKNCKGKQKTAGGFIWKYKEGE